MNNCDVLIPLKTKRCQFINVFFFFFQYINLHILFKATATKLILNLQQERAVAVARRKSMLESPPRINVSFFFLFWLLLLLFEVCWIELFGNEICVS